MAVAAVLLASLLVPAATVVAVDPTSVTIAGSLQSEIGCGGDWDRRAAPTRTSAMTQATTYGRERSPFPPASWEYKAALNDSFDENYGLHAQKAAQHPAQPRPPTRASSSTTTTRATGSPTTATRSSPWRPGSFQSELGCPGDWQPGCLRSWLQDPDGDGTYSFETTALPAGSYATKVAINETWDENYGAGGAPGGDEHHLHGAG